MINKLIFSNLSKKSTENFNLITVAEVLSVEDNTDSDRIVVSINTADDSVSERNVFPILPKHLRVMPSKGDSVFLVNTDVKDSKFLNCLWVGPIISQPHKLEGDKHTITSKSALPTGKINLDVAPSRIDTAKGVFPDKKYVSIQGKNNSDITFKDNEVLIRAGQHKKKQPLIFNSINPGYLQIKHGVTIENKLSTVSNLVSDKINLLTYNGDKIFNLTNNTNMISDDEIKKIIEQAHPAVYGDLLVDFLIYMKNYLLNHVHAYTGTKPISDPATTNKLINFNLSNILSKNIKIN